MLHHCKPVFTFSGIIVGRETFYIRPLNDQDSNTISDEHVWVNSKDEPHDFKCGTGMSVSFIVDI